MSGGMRRLCWLAGSVAGLVWLCSGAGAVCPRGGDIAGRIASVEPRLVLRLADGRLLRLAGLDPAQPTPAAPDLDGTARTRLAALLAGKSVTWQALAGSPDRWGRTPAFVFMGEESGDPGGAATLAVAAGLGRYLAEPAARACRDTLVAAETKAREAKLGLWIDPYYAVLGVEDRAGFAERSATIVLVEGDLVAVEPGPYRTTLRFARPGAGESGLVRFGDDRSGPGSFGGHMLVATILPRSMKTFEAQGVEVRTLIGHRIRLRGLLDLRFGPRIELADPDQIEAIAVPGAATVPSHSN